MLRYQHFSICLYLPLATLSDFVPAEASTSGLVRGLPSDGSEVRPSSPVQWEASRR